MDILDDTGVSKLSAKVFFKVNYSFKGQSCNLCDLIMVRLISDLMMSCNADLMMSSCNRVLCRCSSLLQNKVVMAMGLLSITLCVVSKEEKSFVCNLRLHSEYSYAYIIVTELFVKCDKEKYEMLLDTYDNNFVIKLI